MNWLLICPIVIPLAAAVVGFAGRGSERMQRAVSLAGAIGLSGAAAGLLSTVWRDGIVSVQIGGWPAPYGITLVADHLSAAMVAVTALIGLATVIYAFGDVRPGRLSHALHPLLHALLAGVCGAFLAGDIFNLYVWFEIMLIASLALLVLGGTPAQLDGAVRYAALSLIATTLLLSGIGLLYGLTGTLNMADLHLRVQEVENQGLLTLVAMVFIIAFGLKSAVFPLFFWLPASYHTPQTAVSAVFSGLLTKVGVYALMRFFTLIFRDDVGYTHELLLWVAGLTMVTGVLGAASQNELRRILSFHIISQIGYMILGLALFTTLGLLGGIFYVIHHIIVKANLFFVSGAVNRLAGSTDLKTLGGLYRDRPLLATLFFVPAFSLAGFPPLSGFWAKLLLIRASVESDEFILAGVALVVGLLTVFSMTKIWLNAFWKARPDEAGPMPSFPPRRRWLLLAPIATLATITLVIGLYARPLYVLAERAATELMDPSIYVEAVLDRGGVAETARGYGDGAE
ncbi:MAG: Na+/H+ antiporter subunit D [Acidobacteria bacterium]|nr:Na+/H+ antiporter subunit D [Acidobacteriota bacterium]MYJ06094.1 Na+/H+ antiporter subunit D [Acidobacteriota bacterium]